MDVYSIFSPRISKEPVHVYDEIDESLVVHKSVGIKNSKEGTSVKYDRYQSEVEIQKKKLESIVHQTSVSSPQDPEVPELPNREYLTDIDFVAQEFDLLLTRAPELPKRMEDSTNLLTSTDVMADDKNTEWGKHIIKQHHGTQQSLIRQELERSVSMAPQSAPPKMHNLIKGSKTLLDTTQSQNKKEEMGHKFPGEIKPRKPGPGFKHCASIAHQQPHQKPTGTRPLPYRQPMKAVQSLQPVTGNQNGDTCPTYQNVTEECTYDDTVTVNYQNVTGEVYMAQKSEVSYQNILSKQKQQIREETATYQPLIFHCAGTEEDEYMEMDTMY